MSHDKDLSSTKLSRSRLPLPLLYYTSELPRSPSAEPPFCSLQATLVCLYRSFRRPGYHAQQVLNEPLAMVSFKEANAEIKRSYYSSVSQIVVSVVRDNSRTKIKVTYPKLAVVPRLRLKLLDCFSILHSDYLNLY